MRQCYAHSIPGCPPELGWETVGDHLRRVADGEPPHHPGAGELASCFGAASWGRLAGYWHDLGKFSDAFQDYLLTQNGFERDNAHVEDAPGRVDHSTFGAKHAITCAGAYGWLLAYTIAGHHGGMPDFASLDERRSKDVRAEHAPPEILELELPEPPPLRFSRRLRGFQIAFFTRMLFSALVDADFLATESFMAPDRRQRRTGLQRPDLRTLAISLDAHLDQLASRSRAAPINRHRAEVLAACRERANDQPGLFSLTVPTGGGKTLSSLAFALGHAIAHDLRRVIYGVPFTSIIEQNAGVFRRALRAAGPNAVLEHHSNFDMVPDDRWSRLASENWDAPLIVTTNVQLLESLFHNRPSRCRKLHNVARSVIILDEAQTIPVNLLEPTLAALHELVHNYGCTIVLCTATQPAIVEREDFPIGLPAPTEIAPDVAGLFSALKRTDVDLVGQRDDAELATELASAHQALCIVHTRSQARLLFETLGGMLDEPADLPLPRRSCLHLSTNMCPAHRSLVVWLIRRRLRAGLPCRVISTSLVEAGVDVDFPIVFRAIAGLDSIAQAAGRCNREGRQERPGRVIVYRPASPVPTYAREAVRDAEVVIGRGFDDLLAPEAIEDYFKEHYWQHADQWDCGARDHRGLRGPVMGCFPSPATGTTEIAFDFQTAAERYRVIEDDHFPVVIPWRRRGRALVERLRDLREPAGRALRRACQRFAVGMRRRALDEMASAGIIMEPGELARGLFVLELNDAYDPAVGLDSSAGLDPGWLIEGS